MHEMHDGTDDKHSHPHVIKDKNVTTGVVVSIDQATSKIFDIKASEHDKFVHSL